MAQLEAGHLAPGRLQVLVHGVSGNLCSLPAEPSWSIRDVREAICEATAIPPSQQRLLMGCEALNDGIQLDSLCVDSDELSLTLVRRSLDQAKLLEAVASGEKLAALLEAPEARSDKEVMMAVVQKDGLLLRFAQDSLKADEDVVFEAVRQNRVAMRFAAESLARCEGLCTKVADQGATSTCAVAGNMWPQFASKKAIASSQSSGGKRLAKVGRPGTSSPP